MRHDFAIGPPDAGRRLDRYLQKALGGVPPSLVQRLIRTKKVRRNGVRAKGDERLEAGDTLVVHHAVRTQVTEQPAQELPDLPEYKGPRVEIIDRDADFLTLSKPAGATCSIDKAPELSLAAFVNGHLRSEIESGAVRPELCHRLDRGTTGLVVVALSAEAVTAFHGRIAAGDVEKRYLAVAWGQAPDAAWYVDQSLRRSPHAPKKRPKVVAAQAGGKGTQSATTLFKLLGQGREACLLEATPVTGRTHQIRAHLLADGLPIVADPRYGDSKLDAAAPDEVKCGHQLLHAWQLGWRSDGEEIWKNAKPPQEFLRALKRLGLHNSLLAYPVL